MMYKYLAVGLGVSLRCSPSAGNIFKLILHYQLPLSSLDLPYRQEKLS